MPNTQKLIAVLGATGHQGGAVVRALQQNGRFKVRALTRHPEKHPKLGDEVVLADVNRPETLEAAFAGAHGAFLVGDIAELGRVVAGAFMQPEIAGRGEHLPLVGDFLTFSEIVATLNRQGHKLAFKQVPREVFATWFPGADGIAAMLAWFEKYTYLGADSCDEIALADKVAGRYPTPFATWAQENFTLPAAA